MRDPILELLEALRPFAACHVESFGSIPDDKAYLWKPTETHKELPGISIADIKKAQAVFSKYRQKD